MSTTHIDVRALARLARLEISDAEVVKLEQELPAIVAFVDTLQKVAVQGSEPVSPEHRNVMRDDENPRTPGEYTERLLNEAPGRDDGYFVVKQVLKK
jgi:aspartyl-tRNA(Asn)/glutamyl-tRNA(Gln) amidotransferase subunit C